MRNDVSSSTLRSTHPIGYVLEFRLTALSAFIDGVADGIGFLVAQDAGGLQSCMQSRKDLFLSPTFGPVAHPAVIGSSSSRRRR